MQSTSTADPPFGVVNSVRNPAPRELAQGDFEILGPFSEYSRGLFRLLFTASFYSLSTSLTQSYWFIFTEYSQLLYVYDNIRVSADTALTRTFHFCSGGWGTVVKAKVPHPRHTPPSLHLPFPQPHDSIPFTEEYRDSLAYLAYSVET